jgi:hypothetical protein
LSYLPFLLLQFHILISKQLFSMTHNF